MPPSPSAALAPLVWLVAAQFGLYALGWLVCSRLLHRERAAVVHWALFMLSVGAGFVLMSGRDAERSWWPYVGANLAFLLGYAALWRGMDRFFGSPASDLERGIFLLGGGGVLVLLGPGDDAARLRVATAFALGGWAMLRVTSLNTAAVRDEFGPRVARVLSWLGWGMLLAMSARALQQLLLPGQVLEMHRDSAANQRLLFAFIGFAALFNFGFIGLLIARLLARLHRQARHDPLTGVCNRRAFDDVLQRHWQRWCRGGPGFALLALDLDHFKQVNDQHGHPVGDAVLVAVAERLQAQARPGDVLARMGGEEFMLLMPQADASAAWRTAERLRQAVSDNPLALEGLALRQTLSVGVGLVQPGEQRLQPLLKRVDAALYRAKHGGRNRVVLADEAAPDEATMAPV